MDLITSLWQIVLAFSTLVVQLLSFALQNALVLVWLAWALFAIDWKKTWPILVKGAWIPLVLVVCVTASVWSQLFPREVTFFEAIDVGNFWWQLVVVSFITVLTLLCGWLQGVMGLTPYQIEIDPPAPEAHAHGHH